MIISLFFLKWYYSTKFRGNFKKEKKKSFSHISAVIKGIDFIALCLCQCHILVVHVE